MQSRMFSLVVITFAGFLIAAAIMSVGVVFGGRCLRGSCGGEGAVGPDGEPLTCATCPNRKKQQPPALDGEGATDRPCSRESNVTSG